MFLLIHFSSRREKDAFFDRMYLKYYHYIYAVIFNVLHSHEEVHDLVQDSFLKAWIGVANMPEGDAEKAWLGVIARNTAKNFIKRKGIQKRLMVDVDEDVMIAVASSGDDPAVLVADEDTVARAYEYMRNMDERYRDVMILHYEHKQSPDAIARTLERKPKTVYTQIARGREMVREWIQSNQGGNV